MLGIQLSCKDFTGYLRRKTFEFKRLKKLYLNKGLVDSQDKQDRLNVVFRIVQNMSEQSLEFNRMPDEAVYPGPL